MTMKVVRVKLSSKYLHVHLSLLSSFSAFKSLGFVQGTSMCELSKQDYIQTSHCLCLLSRYLHVVGNMPSGS